MGKMAAAMMLDALASLTDNPLSEEEMAAAYGFLHATSPSTSHGPLPSEELPAPMLPGNYEHEGNMCFMWSDIKNMTIKAHNWAWSDEGKNKWGE